MKIRTGFVSNSSSSSFVVDAKSSMEVFNKMLPMMKDEYIKIEMTLDGSSEFRDYPVDNNAWKKYHEKNIERFQKSHDENFNGAILVPFTCNFETYIFPVKNGECYVETCNNTLWDEVMPDLREVDDRYLHDDNKNYKFTNVSTNKITTLKTFHDKADKAFKKYIDEKQINGKQKVVKEDVSCGFSIGLYMTNDECISLNTRLEEEGYNLEDYRACTKFLLKEAGIEVTPDEKLGKDKVSHLS